MRSPWLLLVLPLLPLIVLLRLLLRRRTPGGSGPGGPPPAGVREPRRPRPGPPARDGGRAGPGRVAPNGSSE
ncbi:hypothetical protein GCM10010289_11530 [Streptomyces violascens]|uniref:Secreted protein n=2 Tax=Streptomyces violascens TaxID=67381 RepID=A0ABQ3QKK2_9ACTN|nr:hypothetical protein GCM10010289_11530 [Streptomyces violascens]GHI37798.1 hypothetical protein Sviol_22060 [Streptomyces violascens]